MGTKRKKDTAGIVNLMDVATTWLEHVVRNAVENPDPKQTEPTIKTYIFNRRKEGANDDDIYSGIEELFPLFGNPYNWFRDYYLKESDTAKIAWKTAEKQRKAAVAAYAAAEKEFHNKRRCIEVEREVRQHHANISAITTPTTKGPGSVPATTTLGNIGVGVAVKVAQDLSPGKCSHGGSGFVINIVGNGPSTMFTVKYNEPSGGTTECNIGYNRLTILPAFFASNIGSRPKRKRCGTATIEKETLTETNNNNNNIDTRTIVELLIHAKSVGRAKGWRAKDLNVYTHLKHHSEKHDDLFTSDLKYLEGFMDGCKNGKLNRNDAARNKTNQFKKSKTSATTKTYLYFAWGVGRAHPSRVSERINKRNLLCGTAPTTKHKSVIDDVATAIRWYSPKLLFVLDYVKKKRATDLIMAYNNEIVKENKELYCRLGNAAWNKCNQIEKDFWESVSRTKLEIQPTIKDSIIEILNNNPSLSYNNVASEINQWCCGTTIQLWMSSQEGYSTYTQRTLPLLSLAQMKKHVKFAERLLDNWRLPRQKILWIHYDEKWWYGHVNRGNCKLLELLGLEKTHTYVYHKNHVDKVMAVAFTGFAFDSNIENGGDGIKLGFFRCEGARVAKMTVRESRRLATGALVRDGAIVRRSGDVYLVDCNVTGSNEGSSDAPKYSLLALFRDHIFPKVQLLVGPGGRYKGYLPVYQGNNAGPHCDAAYINYVTTFCNNNNMKWEPQAPQMPHANNLDLAVFPAMSKHHSTILKSYANKVAPKNEIWKAAEKVWRDLPSASIARGFILVNRIAKKIIKSGGANTFLQEKEFHSGVRQDFQDTTTGVVRKINVVE